jgi:transcription-repair coupling factor (superfamily II helicase)
VRESKGEPPAESVEPVISVEVEALLPEGYVPEINQRLALYKRLAETGQAEDLAELRSELADRFGPPPPAVEALLEVVALRAAAKRLGVERIEARGGRAVLTFAPSTPVTPERILQSITKSGGGMTLKKEYTVEARVPREPWPAVRDALGALLASLA